MKASPTVATLHGLLTVAAVLGAAFFFPRISPIIYGVVYLATADVLWRMTGASVPWEISKLGLALVSIVVLVRFHKRLPNQLALWYFVLLIPGALIAVIAGGLGAREDISFNLSGPFALACAVALFSSVRLHIHEFRRLTYVAVAPIVAIWVIAFQALLKTQTFSLNSSKAAVGGFGPNQVSTMLGFGALLCIMWAMRERSPLHRLPMAVIGVALLVQSMLTFSRGGLYNVLLALVFVGLLYVRRPVRILVAGIGLVVLVVALSPVFDQIDDFTDGALGKRFAETDLTGRDELVRGDLDVWRQAPVTGVGVGASKRVRASGVANAAAHTEFTRLLAEHGVLGVLALGSLGLMAVLNLRGRVELWEQAWSLALMVWTAGAMSNAAMRVGAVSLAFALASVRLVPTEARRRTVPRRARPPAVKSV